MGVHSLAKTCTNQRLPNIRVGKRKTLSDDTQIKTLISEIRKELNRLEQTSNRQAASVALVNIGENRALLRLKIQQFFG